MRSIGASFVVVTPYPSSFCSTASREYVLHVSVLIMLSSNFFSSSIVDIGTLNGVSVGVGVILSSCISGVCTSSCAFTEGGKDSGSLFVCLGVHPPIVRDAATKKFVIPSTPFSFIVSYEYNFSIEQVFIIQQKEGFLNTLVD